MPIHSLMVFLNENENMSQLFFSFLQLISCLLRGTFETNQPQSIAVPAGFVAGLSSMALYRSTSITIYTAWKTIDVSLYIKTCNILLFLICHINNFSSTKQ